MEILWERLGFSLLGALGGAVYSLVAFTIFYIFKASVDYGLVLQVFAILFAVLGMLFGAGIQRILGSVIYGLYYLWGFVVGIFHLGDFSSSETSKISKGDLLLFFTLGILASVVCIIIG